MLKIKKINKGLQKLLKRNKDFFKFNFYFKYLKKIGFYVNKNVQIYNKNMATIGWRLEKKQVVKDWYKSLSRKKRKKVAKKFFKKWWFYRKRSTKKKKIATKLENTNYWVSKFYFTTIYKNFKFNKTVKKIDKNKEYNNDFFFENFEIMKQNFKDLYFDIEETDEFFTEKSSLFWMDFYIKYPNQGQFFVMWVFDFLWYSDMLVITCETEKKITLKKPVNKNTFYKNIIIKKTKIKSINNNCRYKLTTW